MLSSTVGFGQERTLMTALVQKIRSGIVLQRPLCLLGRRWIDAFSAACFAAFFVFDRILPNAVPEQLKRIFLVICLIVLVYHAYQVVKECRNYKESLVCVQDGPIAAKERKSEMARKKWHLVR